MTKGELSVEIQYKIEVLKYTIETTDYIFYFKVIFFVKVTKIKLQNVRSLGLNFLLQCNLANTRPSIRAHFLPVW